MTPLILALAAAASPAPGAPADPLDKMRCVREEVMGSLASTHKVCHTVREWQQIRSSGNDEVRRVMGTRPDSTGGNDAIPAIGG